MTLKKGKARGSVHLRLEDPGLTLGGHYYSSRLRKWRITCRVSRRENDVKLGIQDSDHCDTAQACRGEGGKKGCSYRASQLSVPAPTERRHDTRGPRETMCKYGCPQFEFASAISTYTLYSGQHDSPHESAHSESRWIHGYRLSILQDHILSRILSSHTRIHISHGKLVCQ